MNAQHPLNRDQFAHVVRYAPLVSIDFIVTDSTQHVFLGLRRNEPAKGVFFVPGGVIRKDEPIGEAFGRILRAETGHEAPMSAARFLGVFEHFYPNNRFDDPGYGTHYVVLAYRLQLDRRPEIRLDDQHSEFRWMSAAELLATPNVHENTKAYFR